MDQASTFVSFMFHSFTISGLSRDNPRFYSNTRSFPAPISYDYYPSDFEVEWVSRVDWQLNACVERACGSIAGLN
jgi:hypothetical protein